MQVEEDWRLYSGYTTQEVAAGPDRWEQSVEHDIPSTEVTSLVDHSPLMTTMLMERSGLLVMRSRFPKSPKLLKGSHYWTDLAYTISLSNVQLVSVDTISRRSKRPAPGGPVKGPQVRLLAALKRAHG